MDNNEFSAKFDVLLNSYNFPPSFGSEHPAFNPALNEYEKSVFLTKAEQELFVSLYNGTAIPGVAFEITEESRRYLDNLVETKIYTQEDAVEDTDILDANSKVFQLEDEVAFITLELVSYDKTGDCFSGFTAKVYPITQDEYARVKDNPFRGPTKYKVIRLDKGNRKVELIPAKGYPIKKYLMKYLRRPKPIILTDLNNTNLSIDKEKDVTECEMNPILHNAILERAVALAVQSKTLGMPSTNNKNE